MKQGKKNCILKPRRGVCMKVISKIGRQKNNPERYNIYLDEKYAFAVDESTLIKFALTKGKILETFEIDEITYEDEIAKAFNRGLNFLSFQMRSEYEVKRKLLEAGFGESVVLEAIRKLEKLGFLNDETYSKALLETKKKTARKGPKAIKQDLVRKGIDKETQNKVLDSFTYEEQLSIAKELAEKAVRANQNKTPIQIKQKIQELLTRKGYSFTIVTEILDRVDIEPEENDWQQLVEKQGDKLWNKYSSKLTGRDLRMKMKQALYQKGFPIEVIDMYLDEKEKE